MNTQDNELMRELDAKFGQFFPSDMGKPVLRIPPLTEEEVQIGDQTAERA